MREGFRRNRTTRRCRRIVLAHGLVLGLVALLGLVYRTGELRADDLVYPACCLLAIQVVWSLESWRAATGRLFDPYVLFFGAAAAFNGGQAVLETLQLNDGGLLKGQFTAEILLETLLLVMLGLGSLHAGALASVLRSRNREAEKRADSRAEVPGMRECRWVGWLLLLVSAWPAVWLLSDAAATALVSGYAGLFERERATGVDAAPQVLAGFLVPATLFLLAGSRDQIATRVVSAIAIVGYSTIQLFIGSRSWAIMPLVAYAWLWHRCIRPISRGILVVMAGVTMFFVLPFIQMMRSLVESERLDLWFHLDRFFSGTSNPAVGIVAEMGASMRTVAHTLELIPSVRDFDMGLGYLYALFTVFPNLLWEIHPAIARGTASDWLVRTVEPIAAARGAGLGFSFIAEAYLNFGWVGVPIVLGLIGFLFQAWGSWAEESRDVARIAAFGAYLAFFLFFARGEASQIVRPAVWYAMMPYIGVCVIRVFRSRMLRRGHLGVYH